MSPRRLVPVLLLVGLCAASLRAQEQFTLLATILDPEKGTPVESLTPADVRVTEDGEQAKAPAWDQVLALPGCHLHLYGKHDAKRGRKMGHLNVTGPSPEAVRAVALQAAAILGLEPF